MTATGLKLSGAQFHGAQRQPAGAIDSPGCFASFRCLAQDVCESCEQRSPKLGEWADPMQPVVQGFFRKLLKS
jgi:hypothetical protein